MHASTTLADIRVFLEAQRSETEPWSTSEAALDGLVGLLVDERDRDDFWNDLAGLIRRLQENQLQRELISGSDVLGQHTTDDLLRSLRASLRSHQGQNRGIAFARQQSQPQSMAGFVLLGLAMACGGDKADDTAAAAGDTSSTQSGDSGGNDSGNQNDSACEEATEAGITGADSETFCELVDLIEASGLSTSAKLALLECLPEMSVQEWETLLENWASMSEMQVENQMQNLANSDCESVNDKHHGVH